MGFGHGGPASVDLAALQFRRLQRLMADTQETDEGSSEPVRSGNPTSGEAAAFPELQHGLSGQFSGPQHADIKHPAQNQRRELSVKPRRHLLLQQLHPARLACSQVARSSSTHVATQRAATGTGQPASGAAHAVHDDTQLATGAEGARSEPNSAAAAARTSGCRWPRPTLPWEQLALEAHRAKRAAAKLSRTQSKQDGDDRTKQHAFSMLSDTGDDTDGFSSNEESEVSGGDSDSGAVWRPRSVADGLLGGSLEQQRLVVHRMLWGAKALAGGWAGLEDALYPASMLPVLLKMLNSPGANASRQEGQPDELGDGQHQQQQARDYHRQSSLDRMACAQSLHAMLSDAVHSMRGADPGVHRRAVGMGLSHAEEYAARLRQAHVAWPVGQPGATEQGPTAGDSHGEGPSTSSASEEADPCQHVEVKAGELERLWVEVQAARGDGGRLAGLLEEEVYGKLLPAVPAVAGSWSQHGGGGGGGGGSEGGGWGAAQEVDMAVAVAHRIETTAWRRLARLAAGGRQEAVEVLHRALLGLLLIHRAHRQPADLLQPPQGSCHPCHLAAFHLVYETMCTAARLSDPGGSDGCIDRSWELPPLAVLYGAVAHLPPECLVLASSPMRGFEPPEPSSGAPFPRLSPQHLSLVVQVLLDQPLLAMCVTAHHAAWRADRMAAQAGATAPTSDDAKRASDSGGDGSPCATGAVPAADSPRARPWACGPVDRAAGLWHKCLAMARAEEVLRAKRQGGSQELHGMRTGQEEQQVPKQQQQQQRPMDLSQAAGPRQATERELRGARLELEEQEDEPQEDEQQEDEQQAEQEGQHESLPQEVLRHFSHEQKQAVQQHPQKAAGRELQAAMLQEEEGEQQQQQDGQQEQAQLHKQEQQQEHQQGQGQEQRQQRSKRDQKQQPPEVKQLLKTGGPIFNHVSLLLKYVKLRQRDTGGVRFPGPAAATVLYGIRTTVQQLAELGLLEEPGWGVGLPAAVVQERVRAACTHVREGVSALQLRCSIAEDAGRAADADVKKPMLHMARAHADLLEDMGTTVDEAVADGAWEAGSGDGKLWELKQRVLQLRAAPVACAKELKRVVTRVKAAVLLTHKDTWYAALQQLAELERQQEREQEEGTGGGGQGGEQAQGAQEQQRRERDARADALRAVLVDAVLGLLAVEGPGTVLTEHMGLTVCAVAGALAGQVWDVLLASPKHPDSSVLMRQLCSLPGVLSYLVTYVPYDMCAFVVQQLGIHLAAAAPTEAAPACIDGAGASVQEAVLQLQLPEPAMRLVDVYDCYARLLLYDICCANEMAMLCHLLFEEGGAGSGSGDDEAGGSSSGGGGGSGSPLGEDVLEKGRALAQVLVAKSSSSFQAFLWCELEHLRECGGLPDDDWGPSDALAPGQRARTARVRVRRVVRDRHASAADGRHSGTGAGADAGAGAGSASPGRTDGSGTEVGVGWSSGVGDGPPGGCEGTEDSDADIDGGGGKGLDELAKWQVLDSGWAAEPGNEDAVAMPLLLTRVLPSDDPSDHPGAARLLLRGAEAAVLLTMCVWPLPVGTEIYGLLPSLPTQGSPQAARQATAKGKAKGKAAAAAADTTTLCVEVRLGRSPQESVPNKYDWDAIAQATIHVGAGASEPQILSALRRPFLYGPGRLGAAHLRCVGVVGIVRALQLVAKVRQELNSYGREVMAMVMCFTFNGALEEEERQQRKRQQQQQKKKQPQQKQQQQGPGGAPADDVPTAAEAQTWLAVLDASLLKLHGVRDIGLQDSDGRCVVAPLLGPEDLTTWGAAGQAAVQLLRALRAAKTPFRELLGVEMLVWEVEVGDTRRPVPPPRPAEGGKGGKSGKGGSSKGQGKGTRG